MCQCIEVCGAGAKWAMAAYWSEVHMQTIAEKLTAPHVVIRPHLAKDGNMWSALYGDNLQEGVCGFGETPALAMADFDKNWGTEKIKIAATLNDAEKETIRQRVEAMRPQIEASGLRISKEGK